MIKYITIATGLLILFVINLSIWDKEVHLAEGESILLALAPVDPRSLMQGDYMTLDYELSNEIRSQLLKDVNDGSPSNLLTSAEGLAVVELDANQVAHFVRLDTGNALLNEQRKLQFRVRNGQVKFATNAFFFEEGSEPIYRDAKYGQFRVNDAGEVLLTGLVDDNFNTLAKE